MNIGKILGKSHSNHLIVRANNWNDIKKIPEIGESVYTSEKKRIGNIADIFGPVVKPFVSIKLTRFINNEESEILNKRGTSLYTLPSSRKPKKKKNRTRSPLSNPSSKNFPLKYKKK